MSTVLLADHSLDNGFLLADVLSLAAPVTVGRADPIVSLALKVEARDPGTADHCQRLSRYASALGRAIGLSAEEISALDRGGYLHDIGKIGIPTAVLQKQGPLTPQERGLVEQHTLIGDWLCAGLGSLQRVRPIVRHHHERMDGSGYPDRLRGDRIPLLARIVGVVDVFDALMSERPYKAALPFERAAEMLREEAARGWRCPSLVDTFLGLIEGGEIAPPAARTKSAGRRGSRSQRTAAIARGEGRA
jgi:putative two-component system response regulator